AWSAKCSTVGTEGAPAWSAARASASTARAALVDATRPKRSSNALAVAVFRMASTEGRSRSRAGLKPSMRPSFVPLKPVGSGQHASNVDRLSTVVALGDLDTLVGYRNSCFLYWNTPKGKSLAR